MHRKEYAHAKDRNKQNRIIQRIVRPAGKIKQYIHPGTDNQRWKKIDLYNFTQPNLKQLEDKTGLLIKGISQEAVVTIHKQRLCKACAAVDCIHNKQKTGQKGQQHFVCFLFDLRSQIERQQHPEHQTQAYRCNPFGGLP